MGQKGDKLSNESVLSTELLLEKLHALSGVTSKKMFGGHGIFHDNKMFGIVDSKGQSFLKVDDSNRGDYQEKNSVQHSRMPYFTIPESVLGDYDLLLTWAKKSIEIGK